MGTSIAVEIFRDGIAEHRIEFEAGPFLADSLARSGLLDPSCEMCRANLAAIPLVLAMGGNIPRVIQVTSAVRSLLSKFVECGHPLATRPAGLRRKRED